MRIMLVDDERIILTGLERILKTWKPDLQVEVLDDAASALDSIADNQPDFLITDIYMPYIDGFELIEGARKHGVKHFAVLTGYDEFSLVRRAIKLKTTDYLLKPVNKEDLFSLVDQVQMMIASEEQAVKRYQYEQLQRIFLYNLLPEDIDQTLGMPLVSLLFYSHASKEVTCCAMQTLEDYFPTRHIIQELDNGCMVVCFSNRTPTIKRDTVCDILSKPPLFDIISEWVFEPYDKNRLYSQYMYTTLTREQRFDRALTIIKHSKEMSEDYTGDCEGVSDYVVGKHPEPFDAIWRMDKLAEAAGLDITFWQIVHFVRLRCEDNRWQDTLGAFFLHAVKLKQPRTDDVKTAVDYIIRHIEEPIGLQLMAKLVHLQKGYFSTVFSREMGTSFIKFLNRMRVQYACRLMAREPSETFGEIAIRCGLDNLQYFFRIFKRYTGMTPGEFRVLVSALTQDEYLSPQFDNAQRISTFNAF